MKSDIILKKPSSDTQFLFLKQNVKHMIKDTELRNFMCYCDILNFIFDHVNKLYF